MNTRFSKTVWCAIRRGELRDFFDVDTMSNTERDCHTKVLESNSRNKHWAASNPVLEVVSVKLEEK